VKPYARYTEKQMMTCKTDFDLIPNPNRTHTALGVCSLCRGTGRQFLIINVKIRARYMAAGWNTIERKANAKLTENTGTEGARELLSFTLCFGE
jgi:hypothetical protein